MAGKEISVIVTYTGVVPNDVDVEEVKDKIERELEDSFRLYFEPESDEEYDEDINEPFFDRTNCIIAEDGYQILL